MGLDQYLYANKYLSPSDWRGEQAKQDFNKMIEAIDANDFILDEMPSAIASVKVAYWRKSNQIHQWFVDNCQGGEDDCRKTYVQREQLQELVDVCNQVLADHNLAEELLPTSDGFFFGSTEYDEWYFGDLMQTVEMLEKALRMPDDWDFEYQSSW